MSGSLCPPNVYLVLAYTFYTHQVEIRDLSKFGSAAVVRGSGVRFEDTTSPVDPGDKGKVAEAVDVCYPDEVRADTDNASVHTFFLLSFDNRKKLYQVCRCIVCPSFDSR